MAGTEAFEMINEELFDSRALLAWGPDRIMLCFRGTVSLKNAYTDFRVRFSASAACFQSLCMWVTSAPSEIYSTF